MNKGQIIIIPADLKKDLSNLVSNLTNALNKGAAEEEIAIKRETKEVKDKP